MNEITATTLSTRLNINRSTASRRVKAAIRHGWLVNKEIKRGQPWDLQIGEPLPEQEGLPTPEAVQDAWVTCCSVAPATGGAKKAQHLQPIEITNDADQCCSVAPHTAGSRGAPSAAMDDTFENSNQVERVVL